MIRRRLLGIDFGSVRVGLAVSDPDRKFSFPLEIRQRQGAVSDAAFYRAVVEREEVGGLVVGLPVHLDGRESPKSTEARAFAAWLAETTGLGVALYDERFTSVQAEHALWDAGLTHKKRKQRRDAVAAQMMLQAYLDAGCPADAAPVALDAEDLTPPAPSPARRGGAGISDGVTPTHRPVLAPPLLSGEGAGGVRSGATPPRPSEQPPDAMNILDRIVATKREEIAAARCSTSFADLECRLSALPPVRDFRAALERGPGLGVIAEVKRASPSAGVIKADFDPVAIARAYADAGANCISVLTDETYFHGHLRYLEAIRAAVEVPLLRKDFVLDRVQLLEARLAGADCVLLIAEILPGDLLPSLLRQTRELGMQALVELYDADNLPRVLDAGATLVGVNNRDLRSFEVRLEHTLELAARMPPGVCLVSESGIRDGGDAARLRAGGARAVLVGETLMRSRDVAATMRELQLS